VASGERTHGTQSVACYVSFETRAFEIYATLPAVQGRIYQMNGPIRKFDSHSREPRSWRTIITG